MNWETGPALGPLTIFGYFLFLAGAALVWRNRGEFSVWVHDEISVFPRTFSPHHESGSTVGNFQYGSTIRFPFSAEISPAIPRPARSTASAKNPVSKPSPLPLSAH